MRSRSIIHAATIVAAIGLLVGGLACASRNVSSGSGDQSATTPDKGGIEPVQQAPVASVPSRPDETASIPSGRSSEGSTALDTRATQFTASAPPSVAPPASASTDLSGLGDIYFDFDRYAIRQDALVVLEGNAQWLRNQSGKNFLIEGHCDEQGTHAYNLVLGEKRAKVAKQYLENLGLPASRIQTTSYGEIKPFCSGHNEGCWKYNRRAHFVVQ